VRDRPAASSFAREDAGREERRASGAPSRPPGGAVRFPPGVAEIALTSLLLV
jgi:hypothetical protein